MEELKQALAMIERNRELPALNWAVNYARHAMLMCERGDDVREIKHQVNYVLSNVGSWRGEDAKWCKAVLKAFVKS
jgi:hypothetical protein